MMITWSKAACRLIRALLCCRHAIMQEDCRLGFSGLSVVDIAHVLQANYAFISGLLTLIICCQSESLLHSSETCESCQYISLVFS